MASEYESLISYVRNFLRDKANQISFSIFILLNLINISQFRSYGISWDEPYMRHLGAKASKYIVSLINPSLMNNFSDIPLFNQLGDYLSGPDTTHGVVFEFPLLLGEVILGLSDNARSLWQFRHFVTFSYTSLICIIIFRLLTWRFNSIKIGLLGATTLLLTPRIFADLFYNPKDAPFMTSYFISTTACIYLVFRPSRKMAILAGVMCAFSICIRPIGILLPTLGALFVLFGACKLEKKATIRLLLYFLLTTLLSIYAMWPYLWTSPFKRFLNNILLLSRYEWDGMVLTDGVYLSSTDLPWNYLFKWMMVTTPIGYLLFIVAGFFVLVFKLFRKTLTIQRNLTSRDLCDLFVFLTVLIPLVLAISLNSTLYDGWRHFYFIYPGMIYLGVKAWTLIYEKLNQHSFFRACLISLTITTLVVNSVWMYKNRPLQNVYFNILAGKDIRKDWEMDYWGLSNLEALQLVVQSDSRLRIKVATGSSTELFRSSKLLPKGDSERLIFVEDWDDADYLVTNYRGVKPASDILYEEGFIVMYRKLVGYANVYTIFKKQDT